MTKIADRYRRLSEDFAEIVAAVPADRWDSQSPCPEWKARDVVRHVVDAQGRFLGFVDRELPPGPSVDDDPAAAWDHVRKAILTNLEDPAGAAQTFQGPMGEQTFEEAVDRFLCGDLCVHSWDLGTAVGIDVQLRSDDMQGLLALAERAGDAMRSSGAFGAALDPPEGADEQTRFLAFIGRKAW